MEQEKWKRLGNIIGWVLLGYAVYELFVIFKPLTQ